MSIFNTLMKEIIVINRPTAKGGVDSEGNWVTSATTDSISMRGNIQPYTSTDISKGDESLPSRSGFDSTSAIFVFTDQVVYEVSRDSQREPDEIEWQGSTYVCWRVFNYMNAPLENLRHCQSVFVKRDNLI